MARQTREGRRISDELLDELLAGDDPAEVFRSGTLVDDLKKAVADAGAGCGDGRASGARVGVGQPP